MITASSIRSALRKLVDKILIISADVDAFCISHFPAVHRRFSEKMERTERVNLLLTLAEPDQILACLRADHAEAFEKHKHLLPVEEQRSGWLGNFKGIPGDRVRDDSRHSTLDSRRYVKVPDAPRSSHIYIIPVIIILILLWASGIGTRFTASNYQKMLMSFLALFPLVIVFRFFWANISMFPVRHRAPTLGFLVAAWIVLSALLVRAGYHYYKAYIKETTIYDNQAQIENVAIDHADDGVILQKEDLSTIESSDTPYSQRRDYGLGSLDPLTIDAQAWRRDLARNGVSLDGGTWAGASLAIAIQDERGETRLDIDDSGRFSFGKCRGRIKDRFLVATCGTAGNRYLLVGILHKSHTLVTANAFSIIDGPNQLGSDLLPGTQTLLAPWEGIMLKSRACVPRNDEWMRGRSQTYWWADIDSAGIASALCDLSICPAKRFASASLTAARDMTQVTLQERSRVTAFRFEYYHGGFLPAGSCSGLHCSFSQVPFSSGDLLAPCKIVGAAEVDGAPLLQQGDAGGIALNSNDVDSCPSGVTIGIYRPTVDPYCY